MKKIVTMFVMMLSVLVVSCATDTDSSDGDDNGGGGATADTTAVRKAITAGGVSFNATGAGTGADLTIDGLGSVATFKAAFLVAANAVYGSEYKTIVESEVVMGGAISGDAFTVGNATITLTVNITGATAVPFIYTIPVVANP